MTYHNTTALYTLHHSNKPKNIHTTHTWHVFFQWNANVFWGANRQEEREEGSEKYTLWCCCKEFVGDIGIDLILLYSNKHQRKVLDFGSDATSRSMEQSFSYSGPPPLIILSIAPTAVQRNIPLVTVANRDPLQTPPTLRRTSIMP